MTRYLTLLITIALIVSGTAAASGAAAPPESRNGYLNSFRDLQGADALEQYSELEVVRTQAIAEVQAGEFSDRKETRMRRALEAMRSFVAATRLAENGSHVESLAAANRTASHLEGLRASDGRQYAALIRLALDRFYENQGQRIYETAQATDSTPRQLRLLSHAATAYQRAGAVERFSTITVELERTRARYRSDLDRMNASTAAANDFVDTCASACDSPVTALTSLGPGVFARYGAARDASRSARTANQLAADHGLSDRTEALSELRARTERAVISLAVGSAAALLGYGVVVALVAAALAHRLVAWARDIEATHVEGIVTTQGGYDV